MHHHGLGVGQIGLIFAVQALFNALSRIPCGRLSDAASRSWPLAVLGLIAFGVSLAVFGLCRTMPQCLAAAIALGVSMGLAFTPIGALIAETAPPKPGDSPWGATTPASIWA